MEGAGGPTRARARAHPSALQRQAPALAPLAALDGALTYPFEAVKIFQQNVPNPKFVVSSSQAVQRTLFVGAPALLQGLLFHTAARASGLGARYGGYIVSCSFQRDGRLPARLNFWESALAGVAAGTVEAAAAAPFSLVKARLIAGTPLVPQELLLSQPLQSVDPGLVAQRVDHAFRLSPAAAAQPLQSAPHGSLEHPRIMEARPSPRETTARAVQFSSLSTSSSAEIRAALLRYPWLPVSKVPATSAVQVMRETVEYEGVRGLFRGLRPTFFRDVAFSGSFFPLWLTFQQSTDELLRLQGKEPTGERHRRPWLAATEAGIAAGLAAIVSHPMDTANTRTQSTVLPTHLAQELKLMRVEHMGLWWGAFVGLRWWDQSTHWRGLGVRVLQQSLSAFALVLGYQTLIRRSQEP